MFKMFRSKKQKSSGNPDNRRLAKGKKVERFLKLLESFARSIHLFSLSFKNVGIIIFIFLAVIGVIPLDVLIEILKT